MRPWHIRTQQEILDRIYEALERGDEADESNEYMRCAKFIPLKLRAVYEDTNEDDWYDYDHPQLIVVCDDARAIDATARTMIMHLERAVRGLGGLNRAITIIRQYRAWKWLLGHPDADTFQGYAQPGPNRTSQEVYEYLARQISSGEWSRMIGQVKKGKERESECYSAIS